MIPRIPRRLCGKEFNESNLQIIREIVRECDPPVRAEIARRACMALDWRDAKDRYKLMSSRVALLKLHRKGLIQLPPPLHAARNGKIAKIEGIDLPPQMPVELPVGKLTGLALTGVADKQESRLWNGLIDRYHYLGYYPLAGAQARYLIRWDGGILGAIGFQAAAWKLEPRDEWIGWGNRSREENLAKVVNNARFLILPWVRCKNLASKVLSLSAKQVPDDFYRRYGIRPVLFETFVETGRFTGASYRAANWIFLGQTQGRGKKDRKNERKLPVKDILVYPLHRSFRKLLGVRNGN